MAKNYKNTNNMNKNNSENNSYSSSYGKYAHSEQQTDRPYEKRCKKQKHK